MLVLLCISSGKELEDEEDVIKTGALPVTRDRTYSEYKSLGYDEMKRSEKLRSIANGRGGVENTTGEVCLSLTMYSPVTHYVSPVTHYVRT